MGGGSERNIITCVTKSVMACKQSHCVVFMLQILDGAGAHSVQAERATGLRHGAPPQPQRLRELCGRLKFFFKFFFTFALAA